MSQSKNYLIILPSLLLALPWSFPAVSFEHETEITLQFTAPTTRTDGSALPNSDILFYRINYGDSPDPLDIDQGYADFENPGSKIIEYRTSVEHNLLPNWSQICVLVTSIIDDSRGGQLESGPSNVVCRDLEPTAPKAVAMPVTDFDGEVSGEFFPWDMRLTWTAPVERIDNSDLPLDQISHYRVYYTEFATDPINENKSKKLNNPGVDDILWRFTVTDTDVASWTSLCGRVKTTVWIASEERAQSEESNVTCHVFSEPPEPPEPPSTIIDLEADVVTITTDSVTINTDTLIINESP